MDQTTVELIKVCIAVAGVVLVAVIVKKGMTRPTWVAAGLLAALSASAFIRFGNFHWPRFLHNWDLYHYYFGAKYFDELGYYDLYRCTLQADDELERQMIDVNRVRDLHTLRFTTAEELLAEGPDCRETFGDARWEEFKGDLEFFYTITPRRLWRRILTDKGYNGTPAWTRYAGAVATWAGTESSWRLVFVCALDEALLLLMLFGVLWAFGPRAFLLLTIFVGINFATRFQHVGGSLLRLDWLVSVVLSLCFLKKGRPAVSGLFLAHATAARVFPLLFAAGLVARALIVVVKERRVERSHLRFALGMTAGLALFGLLGATGERGPSVWAEFGENIAAHSGAPAGKRIGLRYVIMPIGELVVAERGVAARNEALRERWASRRFIALAIAALALLLFAVTAFRTDDFEAFALGVIPVFFLLSPTRYYWAMLAVPVITMAPLTRRWHAETLGTLFLCF